MIKVAPGVYWREVDLSRYIPRLSSCIVGIVGTATKGPTNKDIFIPDIASFTSIFGTPHPNHLAMYSAAQFLRKGNQLHFVRVNGADASKATVNLSGQATAAKITATNRGPFTIAAAAAAVVTGSNTSATRDITTSDNKLLVSINGGPLVTITLTPGTGVSKATIAGEIDTALVAYGADSTVSSNAVRITVNDGTGSSTSVRFHSIANNAYTLLGFSVGVTNGVDSNQTMRLTSIDTTSGSPVDEDLDFTLTTGSRTVDQLVTEFNSAFTTASFPAVATNFNGYLRITHSSVGQKFGFRVTTQSPSLTILGAAKTIGFVESVETYGRGLSPSSVTASVSALSEGAWGNNLSVTVAAGSAADSFQLLVLDGGVTVERFDNLVAAIEQENSANGTKYFLSAINGTDPDKNISRYITVSDELDNTGFPTNGTYSLTGGDDGLESISDDDFVGEVDGNTRTGLQIFAGLLDINILMAPGIHSAGVLNEMITICETRGDCMCLIDPPLGLGVQQVVDWHNGAGAYADHDAYNSSYAALYWPWIQVFDAGSNRYIWTPPSGHIAAVYAYTDDVSDPWWAPAGLNRGLLQQATRVEFNAAVGDQEFMYGNQNAVNMIVKFPVDGIAVWGQRTLQRKPTALDRVNVRRLLLYMRKVITTAVKYLVFEPNDPPTWRSFVGLVDPFLKALVSRRGLYAYQVVCDETTNTPDYIDNNEMLARIYIQPVKAAEKILVDAVLTPTGASFEETIY